MMPLINYDGFHPELGSNAYVAPNAYLAGRVRTGDDCSFWFSCTVRGDTDEIVLGHRVNIQEAATVHTEGGHSVAIGDDVTLGHHALVHGARIGNSVLVGINASVLSGATVGSGSIIGAHALVPEGAEIPPNSLVLGIPGKVIREVRPVERDRIAASASNYVKLGAEYGSSLIP